MSLKLKLLSGAGGLIALLFAVVYFYGQMSAEKAQLQKTIDEVKDAQIQADKIRDLKRGDLDVERMLCAQGALRDGDCSMHGD